MVEFISPDRVKIIYRNLRQLVRPRKYETNGQRTVDESREHCGYFAELYCTRLHKGDEEEDRPPEHPSPKGKQVVLTEFQNSKDS